MTSSFALLRRWVVIAGLALPFITGLPASSRAENHKHHIGLAIGYQKLLSDDLKEETIGVDFTNAGFGALSYRLSLLPNVDFTLDARGTVSTDSQAGVDLTLTNGFFGPGVRIISPAEGVRPFVQVNLYLVNEEAEAESGGVKISASESGAGFGISAGVDIRASDLISIPVEANYMYGKPSDDVSGIGANVGITFNFGLLGQ